MVEQHIYDRFSQTLRDKWGFPDGITEESVREELRVKYRSLIEAIGRYEGLLRFQDKTYSIDYEITSVDRENKAGTFIVTIIGNERPAQIVFRINEDGLVVTRGRLATAGTGGAGQWPISELDDFIERLGFEILRAVGALD